MAAAKTDYYEVLGIPRNADEAAIRRAFHALARECHPDVDSSPDAGHRFRELAEAYSVLSKHEARLLYDRYGYRGRGNQGFDEALWEARPYVPRGENVHLDVELRAFEAEEGTRRVVEYEADVRCNGCMGRGVIGQPDPDCKVCGGTGRRRQVANLDAARFLQIATCPACGSETCPLCQGSGKASADRRIRLRIPPGLEDGAQLRVRGDGHYAGLGSIPGDLLVDVSVLPAPRDPRVVRYVAFMLLLVAVATLVVYLVR